MRFVFRADASSITGSGHVMRLSAIAEEAIARGFETIFVGEIKDLDWVKTHIMKVGFASIIESINSFKSNPESDLLILDSYHIPKNNSFIQPENWLNVISLTDNQTPDYKSNLRIHTGLSKDWYSGATENFLYGKEFIPLRKSIKKRVRRKLTPGGKAINVVVTGGGADPYNFCKSLSKALLDIQGNFTINFITNDSEIADLDSRFSVTPIGAITEDDFGTIDLAFTTASTSSLEFIAREIPIGISCAVENQEIYYHSIHQHGVGACIGMRISTSEWAFDLMVIRELLTSEFVREKLQRKCSEFIDFNGASRIIDEILSIRK
jgi:spore coat polysaccharide biosynthesis predicted glycosyltransferase SpsG